jgi:ATP-binding cassette subfamily F protein 3
MAFGHFGQTNISRLQPNNTVMDEIYNANPNLSASKVRGICGGMMFSGNSADKKVSLLSGGEKSRVMLGRILAHPANLLFLDEPTHHLDMDSIEALTKAIKNFKGSSIIVSHSEELLRRVADRLIIFAQDKAEFFDGGYDLFLEKIGWDDQDDTQEVKVKAAPKSNKKENKKLRAELIQERGRLTSPLKKEVEKLETFIMQTEELITLHHAQIITASNEGESSKVMELSKLAADEERQVEEKFERLEAAQNELDEITARYEAKLAELEE